MNKELSCFKAYDVRGELGVNFNSDICYVIGCAFAEIIDPKVVILGRDVRESSPELSNSLSKGLMDQGVNVYDIGIAGTEEVYWATTHFKACGGIMVTASHNPISFNGLKMVKSKSQPLDDCEFVKIKKTAENKIFSIKENKGLLFDKCSESKKGLYSSTTSFKYFKC